MSVMHWLLAVGCGLWAACCPLSAGEGQRVCCQTCRPCHQQRPPMPTANQWVPADCINAKDLDAALQDVHTRSQKREQQFQDALNAALSERFAADREIITQIGVRVCALEEFAADARGRLEVLENSNFSGSGQQSAVSGQPTEDSSSSAAAASVSENRPSVAEPPPGNAGDGAAGGEDPSASTPTRASGDRPGRSSVAARLWSAVKHGFWPTLTALEWAGVLGTGTVATLATGGTAGIGWLLAAKAVGFLFRRRQRGHSLQDDLSVLNSQDGGGDNPSQAPFPRHLDEARELLALRQSEGRVPVLDALRGMFLDDRAAHIRESGSPEEQAALNRLLAEIDQQVQQVAPYSTDPQE